MDTSRGSPLKEMGRRLMVRPHSSRWWSGRRRRRSGRPRSGRLRSERLWSRRLRSGWPRRRVQLSVDRAGHRHRVGASSSRFQLARAERGRRCRGGVSGHHHSSISSRAREGARRSSCEPTRCEPLPSLHRASHSPPHPPPHRHHVVFKHVAKASLVAPRTHARLSLSTTVGTVAGVRCGELRAATHRLAVVRARKCHRAAPALQIARAAPTTTGAPTATPQERTDA